MVKLPGGGNWYLDLFYKGERIRQSTGTTDHREAERRLAEAKVKVDSGEYAKSKILFSCVAGKWIKEVLPEKAKKSQHRYKQIINDVLIPFFGDKKIVNILEKSLVKKFLHIHEKKSQTTFKHYSFLLRWILTWHMPNFKMPDVKCKNDRWRQTNFLTREEMQKIVGLMTQKFQPLGWILAETGIDVSEAINLKWEHVKNGVLDLPRNKTGIPRKVYLTDKVKSILREQSRVRILGEERIFPDIKSRYGLRSSFKRAVKKSGIGWNVRLKDLRHYFGSIHINAGVDSVVIAQMMGHSDIGMIHRNYGHVSNKGLEDAMRKVSGQ